MLLYMLRAIILIMDLQDLPSNAFHARSPLLRSVTSDSTWPQRSPVLLPLFSARCRTLLCPDVLYAYFFVSAVATASFTISLRLAAVATALFIFLYLHLLIRTHAGNRKGYEHSACAAGIMGCRSAGGWARNVRILVNL